jgi:hypothetical protein
MAALPQYYPSPKSERPEQIAAKFPDRRTIAEKNAPRRNQSTKDKCLRKGEDQETPKSARSFGPLSFEFPSTFEFR